MREKKNESRREMMIKGKGDRMKGERWRERGER